MNLGLKCRQVNYLRQFVPVGTAALCRRHNFQTVKRVSPLGQVGRYISAFSGGITRIWQRPARATEVPIRGHFATDQPPHPAALSETVRRDNTHRLGPRG